MRAADGAGTARLPVAAVMPGFTWTGAPTRPAVPAGSTDTAVTFDHRGGVRSGPQVAGAFALFGADPPPVVAPLVGLPLGAAIHDAADTPAVVALPPLATAGIRLDGRSVPRVIR